MVEFYSEQDKRFVKGGVFEENNYSRAITVTDEWQRVDRLIRVNGEDKKSKLNFGFTIYSATAEFYVDDVNIYEATKLAMKNAIDECKKNNKSIKCILK